MMRLEILALAISKQTGCFDTPESEAFRLRNPGLLKTWRPEKKTDSDHRRIFTSVMGGFKALVADLQTKCEGKHRRLPPESSLRDLLVLFDFKTDTQVRPVILFIKRALADDSVSANTLLAWFVEPVVESVSEVPKDI